MEIRNLVKQWAEEARGDYAPAAYEVRLPLEDAAKIEALAEMFPRRSREQLITDLLSAALDQLVSSIPYEEGNKVISRDELGDPVYEDVGLTPRYLELTHRHAERLRDKTNSENDSCKEKP